MNPARIAELLKPFLEEPFSPKSERGNVTGPAVSSEANVSAAEHSEARSAGEPAALSPAQLAHISTYIDILLRWNARINLTAIRDPEEVVTRHFGESLFAARVLFPDGARASGRPTGSLSGRAALQGRVTSGNPSGASVPDRTKAAITAADIGSGAGFPGLPLKLWVPEIHLTLIESNHKKAAFLSEVTRALTLTNVDIRNTRAETLPAGSFDLVTLRAVERFESILPTAAAVVAPLGRLALLIGSAQLATAQSTLPAFTWSNPHPIPLSNARILVVAHRH